MNAGFCRAAITPPLGTRMSGWAGRDREHGCTEVHDDLYARALYLSHAGREALVIGFDLLFFSREEADRLKGAIGRRLDLAPGQILLNTSHTHAGPKVGTWAYDPPSDPYYLPQVEVAILRAAEQARDDAVEVTLWAGTGHTELPLSRRLKMHDGTIAFAPNPAGHVCNTLPVCLMKDGAGAPVCLLFSVSCHPSTISGFAISADYPGVAMAQLDARLGRHASLFLQGVGGDSKVGVIGGRSQWRKATWDDVEAAGVTVAGDVVRVLEGGLQPVAPDLRTGSVEMAWPLEPAPDYAEYERVLADSQADETRRLWARDMLHRLDRGERLPDRVPVTLHGLKLGRGLRMVALEGEPVAELGRLMMDFYGEGITFPLGYTDGTQLYLTTSAMLDEGGYEADSFYEYRWPARLAKGMEGILLEAQRRLSEKGID